LRRSYFRALLAPAAVAAAVALAGCDADSIAPRGRALAPLSDKMVATLAEKNMDKESPILVRLFKEESEFEVWKKNRDGEFALLKTYPICRWSGDLGPKKREGDRQAPEGFYTISPGQMNPQSNYYLAFNTGYPNAYDRAWGYTGSELMVHGDCSSRGCYAMTDEQIQEIYALARESFFGGQKSFQFDAFPFRMTALNMAKHRNNPNFAFWKMLKEGYDNFEATKQPPQVAVCEQRYLFDQVDKDGQALSPRNARAACPVHKLDPQIADAVLEHRRDEQTKMANYIAEGVQIAAAHVGDGGMNPVFADKLETQTQYDAKGQLVQIAVAPGALPKVPNPPGTTIPRAQVQPEQQPAETQPEQSQQPIALASVPKREAAPKPAVAHRATNALALRGTNTELAAKPKRVSTADPKEVAKALAATRTHTAAAKPAESDVRTAYSTATIAGAQPAMPVGSFDARWGGLR